MSNTNVVAIVLAGGQGKRMNSDVSKQYLLLRGKPILAHTLIAFENSDVNEIILVSGEQDIEYCRKEIVEKYNITKVRVITAGGVERYHSVYNGLLQVKGSAYVLIHDGARPFISVDTINTCIEEVLQHDACVIAVPTKDTIKIVDEKGYVINTPARETLWCVQTPQAFEYRLILNAYKQLMENENIKVTDDAMVVELTSTLPVKIIQGSYTNIKITTPEDIIIGERILDGLY